MARPRLPEPADDPPEGKVVDIAERPAGHPMTDFVLDALGAPRSLAARTVTPARADGRPLPQGPVVPGARTAGSSWF